MEVPEEDWVATMIEQGKKHNRFDEFIPHYVQEMEFDPRYWSFGDPNVSDLIEDLTELCHYLLTVAETGTTKSTTSTAEVGW